MQKRIANNSEFIDNLITIGGVIAAGAMAVAYLFSTFETKSNAQSNKDQVDRRLERIENKIDQIYERTVRKAN